MMGTIIAHGNFCRIFFLFGVLLTTAVASGQPHVESDQAIVNRRENPAFGTIPVFNYECSAASQKLIGIDRPPRERKKEFPDSKRFKFVYGRSSGEGTLVDFVYEGYKVYLTSDSRSESISAVLYREHGPQSSISTVAGVKRFNIEVSEIRRDLTPPASVHITVGCDLKR